jgi:hypothetical protein
MNVGQKEGCPGATHLLYVSPLACRRTVLQFPRQGRRQVSDMLMAFVIGSDVPKVSVFTPR